MMSWSSAKLKIFCISVTPCGKEYCGSTFISRGLYDNKKRWDIMTTVYCVYINVYTRNICLYIHTSVYIGMETPSLWYLLVSEVTNVQSS